MSENLDLVRSRGSEQVALVERFCDAWSRRDHDGVLSVVSSDVVYRPIASFAEAEECRGHDALRRFFDGFWEAWADDAVWRLETTRVYGEAVIALSRFSGHARASGVEVTGGVFAVYRFRDGKIAQIEDFADRAHALAAVGAEE
jgi:ketosteroid isomerase-like protein